MNQIKIVGTQAVLEMSFFNMDTRSFTRVLNFLHFKYYAHGLLPCKPAGLVGSPLIILLRATPK